MIMNGLRSSIARLIEGLHGTIFVNIMESHLKLIEGWMWLAPISVRHFTITKVPFPSKIIIQD